MAEIRVHPSSNQRPSDVQVDGREREALQEALPFRLFLPRKLFGKISMVFSILLLLLSGLQVLLTVHFWTRSLEAAEQLSLWRSAAYLGGVIATKAERGTDLAAIEREAFSFWRANPRASIYLLDQYGTIIYRFYPASGQIAERISMEPIRKFLQQSTPEAPLYGQSPDELGTKTIFSAAPVNIRGQELILYIVFSDQRWRDIWQNSFENALGASALFWMGLSTVAIAALAFFLFQPLAHRFAKISQTVQWYHAGDFTHRIGTRSSDELGILGQSIDEMASRIQQSMTALQDRDRLRRELVANVSHDLRGPLHNIQGNLDGFREGHHTAEERAQFLKAVERNVSSLGELLSQLFELAKLEAQEAHPDFEDFPLDELLDDIRTGYASRAIEQGIRCEVDIRVRPVFARGDIRMLDRVLMNLLENALKFTPPDGKVILRLETIGDRARVSIVDTGKGISAGELPHVTEKSYQGEHAPKVAGSSGLGLAIVERLLQAHGTSLEISSQLNEGSTFAFTLPLAPNESIPENHAVSRREKSAAPPRGTSNNGPEN